MSSDVTLSQLIINKLTQSAFDSATKNPNELYLITDKTPQVVQNLSQTVDSSTVKYPSDYAVTQYVKNSTITIQKNGTSVGTFTLNQSSNKSINIPVPNVVNNVTSTSTSDALSANQGKLLQDQITTLKGRGRFLSTWDATIGKPETFPATTPYTYSAGDYYIVNKVGTINYKPYGFSYDGSASTTVEFNDIAVGDTYIFDGNTSNWILQINHTVTTTFANIAGSPFDNSNLAAALNSKQDSLPSKDGSAGKALYVNASGNGYEYSYPIMLLKYT